jgi:hypothetical protein
MDIPQEHLTYLRRTGYAAPRQAALTEAEAAILARYGYWMEALAGGLISPTTPEQSHFLQVARGEVVPQTPFERIWGKLVNLSVPTAPPGPVVNPRPDAWPATTMADPADAQSKFEELAQVQAYASELRKRADAEREQVLDKVRAELQAIDAKYERALQEASQALKELEAEVKAEVLQEGRSVRVGPVQAVFYRGRVAWDPKGLERFRF